MIKFKGEEDKTPVCGECGDEYKRTGAITRTNKLHTGPLPGLPTFDASGALSLMLLFDLPSRAIFYLYV